MKNDVSIAYLIMAHQKQEQLTKLVNCLGYRAGYENIFIHINKKSDIDLPKLVEDTSSTINLSQRFTVYWGGFNQLQSIVSLMEEAVLKKKYDFVILLSGQDLPVASFEKITGFLAENKGKTFLEMHSLPEPSWDYNQGLGRVQWPWFMDYVGRFRGVQRTQQTLHRIFRKFNIIRPVAKGVQLYGGPDWWMFPGEVAEYCVSEFKNNTKIRSCFKYSFIPSEMFFHTVIANSHFKDTITGDNRRFIPWRPNHAHPEIITEEYKEEIKAGGYLFGRKFDYETHPGICEYYMQKFTHSL